MDLEKPKNSSSAPMTSPKGGRPKGQQQLRPSAITEAISFILCTTSPLFVIYYWIVYHYFDTSITAAARTASSEGLIQFFATRFPHPNAAAILGYSAWLALQAVLYIYLPGTESLGPVTPTGRRLRYKLNGLAAWGATVALWAIGTTLGVFDPAYIAKNWESFMWTINIFAVSATMIFHIKAHIIPDNEGETFITGKFSLSHFRHASLNKLLRFILVRHLRRW